MPLDSEQSLTKLSFFSESEFHLKEIKYVLRSTNTTQEIHFFYSVDYTSVSIAVLKFFEDIFKGKSDTKYLLRTPVRINEFWNFS